MKVEHFIGLAAIALGSLGGCEATFGLTGGGSEDPLARIAALQDGNQTIFAATDDAYVKSRYPKSNYDRHDYLRVRETSSEEVVSYLRFDVSGIDDASMVQAVLRLHCSDGSGDGGSVFRAASDDWTEGSLSYANAPGPVGDAVADLGAVSSGQWIEIDVSDAVVGGGTVSFVVANRSSNSAYYDSRESSFPPELIVVSRTVIAAPEPAPPPPPEPAPEPAPAPAPTGSGILISAEEIMLLPTSGSAWNNLLSYAAKDASSPNLSDQDDHTDEAVVAKALVYARTGDAQRRQEVEAAIMAAIETENGGRTLALGRNLAAYVIAADLIGLDGANEKAFRSWLDAVRYETLSSRTLISTHEDRPNNWGTHAGAARIAAALYLGDTAELERAAAVFHGYLGNRSAYAGFSYGDLSWQCDPSKPVGINPKGCTIDGHSVDGVLPDDQRRGGTFSWPPPKENYVWEALQGVVLQAYLLQRAGYPAFEWEDRAILRAITWLHEQADFPAANDDSGTPWMINAMYGTTFPTTTARPSKNGVAYYDWLVGPS